MPKFSIGNTVIVNDSPPQNNFYSGLIGRTGTIHKLTQMGDEKIYAAVDFSADCDGIDLRYLHDCAGNVQSKLGQWICVSSLDLHQESIDINESEIQLLI